MFYALAITMCAITAAWSPIFVKFFQAWRSRHNPVSLAICGVIALVIYSNAISLGVSTFDGNPLLSTVAVIAFNMVACLNCYLAFRWSDRKFHSDRKN
jgi:hypothetical protein